MQIKPNSTIKIICIFLLILCCLFVTCKEPADFEGDEGNPGNNNGKPNNPAANGGDGYNNPNAGAVKELTFSHDSGLYGQQFSLTIKAPEGSSIYYSTDGSVPVPNKTGTVKYSSPITVKNRNGEANILAANAAKFYMAPDDKRGSVPQVYQPNKDQVPKATVIRAIAVSSSGEKSGVATKTYFIGNNLNDYGNHRVVSLVSDPDNLVSEARGIMVRGKSSNRWDSEPPYNFRMKGADWEREAYLEIFEGNSRNKASLSTGVGIRVRGGWSRGVGQKSFSVYFKEQYGIKNLKNYNLIPKNDTLGTTGAVKADGKTPVAQYKGFMLRNGANDIEYTKFYDVFLQDLLSDRSFSTQASIPCVVYLNGEYWGPYNFQERHSDNQTEYKYGVDKDNVISYDNGELDDGNSGEEPDFNQMITMASSNYSAFCDIFDIDNFIDYWAAEIYIYNEDWPQNNYRMWRTRNVEPGNPYGDTKWRYQMFDTEFAMGIYSSGGLTGNGANKDAFARILDGADKNHPNNKLFAALLKNPDFCRKFVNTMMDLYNVNFHPDIYGPKLSNYESVYRPLMNGYFDRWGRPWQTAYENKVNDARNYLKNIRTAMVNNYLPNYFSNIGISGSNLCNVTLSVTGVSGASIKINSVIPNITGSWTGKYYFGIPIIVTASDAPNGYEFDGWTVTGGTAVSPSAKTTTVNLSGDTQIKAKYKLNQNVAVPVTSISLSSSLALVTGNSSTLTATVNPTEATFKTVFWSSSNPSVATVNDNGRVTAVKSGTAVITASTAEGKNATCTVTVTAAVNGVVFSASTYKFIYGETRKLDITISPSNAPNKQAAWSSSNTSVAIVSNDGTVTAKSVTGSTTITVTTDDGSKTATCTVSVKAATVLLDLAAKLQTLTPGVISDNTAFSSMFSGLPISPGGSVGTSSNADAEYSIITENSVKKLQFIEFNGGCPGLDLYNNQIHFRVGDIIEIKGTFAKIHSKCNGVVLNTNNWGWNPLQDWGYWSQGGFEHTFILTQEDVNNLQPNEGTPGIRIRSSGVDYEGSWNDRFPGGIGKVILEQVKIYGYRD